MRTLSWDGLPNVRDLGGLPTALSRTGRTVFGRIARGPRRELLTEQGWGDAERWGLRTVVDLRCADEVGRRPEDPDVGPAATRAVALVHAPTEDHGNAEFRELCFPVLDSPAYWQDNWRILPHLVRDTLTAIAEAEPGVLVHCSAGRDRTGMITALLLGNAGVSPGDVAADYARSVRAMAGTPTHAPTHDRQTAWDDEQVTSWVEQVAPLVAEAAARATDVLDEVGVGTTTRRRLRDLLTGD